jgi:hypothetical protein
MTRENKLAFRKAGLKGTFKMEIVEVKTFSPPGQNLANLEEIKSGLNSNLGYP